MNRIYYFCKYIAVLGFFLFAQQSLFAVPPTQLLPQDTEDCVSLDATFRWTSTQNASRYMYIISTKADFSDTVTKNFNYPDTTKSFQLPNYATNYYWKVGSHIIGQTDEWSAGYKLTTSPAPPTLISPVSGLKCQDFTQTFKWNSVQNAVNYQIEISKSVNFSQIIKDTLTSDTSYTLKVNDYFQDYYWRVSAKTNRCKTDRSAIRQFQTVVGPPELSAPLDSAKGQDLTTTLQWPTAPGALNYDLQVSDKENFSNLLVDETNYNATSFNYTATTYNKQLWWRLRTNGTGCTSVWSESFTYKTAYPTTRGLVPNNLAECVSISTTFVWESVPGATTYHIQASKTESFTDQDILFESKLVNDTTIVGNVRNATARIYWRVKANDESNTGLWSNIKSYFTTGEEPIAIKPLDGDVEVPRGVHFEWTNIGQSQSFRIQVATDSLFTNIEIDSSGFADKKIDLVVDLYNTYYYYRVRSILNDCESEWFAPVKFKSIQGFPNLISPINTEENVSVDYLLEWSAVPTAINYDLRISTKDDFSNETGQNGITTNNFFQKGLEQNTTYYWKVRSNDQWGTSPWSLVYEFTTGAGFTNVPELISPTRNSVKLPVDGIMNWKRSVNATSYNLEISTHRNFIDGSIIKRVTSIPDTVYNYEGLSNFTEYWFRVASVNETVTSDYSAANRFRTIALVPSEVALAVTPVDGSDAVGYQKIAFQWTEVDGTNLGLLSESGYEFLISTKQDFADTLLYDKGVKGESKTYNSIFANNTTYFWKVRGWNEAGFGPWSEVFSFTTDPVTSVNDGNYFDFGANIAPNPIQNNAELRFTLDTPGNVTFVLIDQTGKEVFRMNNISANSSQNIIPMNFDNLSNGTYLFNLQVGTKYQTGKIIISR